MFADGSVPSSTSGHRRHGAARIVGVDSADGAGSGEPAAAELTEAVVEEREPDEDSERTEQIHHRA